MGAAQSELSSPSIEKDGVGDNQLITFILNDKTYRINPDTSDNDIGPEYKLVDFIRYKAGLTGTKYMCREGGCGCCCVMVKSRDASGNVVTKSVNSCLIPILACDGWQISTVESLGNKQSGYSGLQQRLVKFGGTQCGFCSPGMIMNMNSLIESKPNLKQKDVEHGFDGNICRCTGYRPILDAFKSYASDAPEELKRKCGDIEDSSPCSDCPSRIHDIHSNVLKSVTFENGDSWVKATTMTEAFVAMQRFHDAQVNCRIVAGNTGTGVFKRDTDDMHGFIYINHIPELQQITLNSSEVILGAGTTLAIAIDTLRKAATFSGFQYVNGIAKHWERIANTPVRNAATIAGNLMMKRLHKEFPSDVFLTLEAVQAELAIASSPTDISHISVLDLMSVDMDQKLIVSIKLKPLSSRHIYRSFKISRRFQNAHAYVNAAFCMEIDRKQNYWILGKPNILYGGIADDFVHAEQTENFLTNKPIRGDSSVLLGAMATLESEIKPDSRPPDGSPVYRKRLTQTLLYKCLLGILGSDASIKMRSGAKNIKRNVSHGSQTYDTDKTTWPINEPILKLESYPQVSGEAEYINDIAPSNGELFGAFVLSKVSVGNLVRIDASEAQRLKGVVKFVQASDIPGINNYMVFADNPEEIFARSRVEYTGQPIGLILAESRDLAFKAAELVKVTYSNVSSGIVSIEEKLAEAEKEGTMDGLLTDPVCSVEVPNLSLEGTTKVIGEFQLGSQYHNQMETHVTICVPKEDGLDVYSSTQWMDLIQAAIASSCAIPTNEVNVTVRRLGGAYGCKLTRATHVACACAIGAQVTNRPVRVALDMETNMRMIGKRAPFLMKYEIDVDDGGKIVALKGKIFCNTGMESGEETAEVALSYMQSWYEAKGWQINPANVNTNTPSNTWCRAPGSTPGIALIENIMEHISFALNKDPLDVRMANAIKDGDLLFSTENQRFSGDNLIPRMIEELKVSGDIEGRKKFINDFNSNNRWKKRGMAMVPMRYPLDYFGSTKYPAYVAIYKNDGTVAVSTGGIECGQGLNTKVAQAVAYEFGIPVEKVKVKPSNTLVAPNADSTGGSISSELCVFAALMCCKILNERMKAIKVKSKAVAWETLVKLCYTAGIQLSASYMPGPQDNLKSYDIWVVNLTEVEIDCLTGENKVVRVDIIEDAGKSLNPEIDVGQVEGALVMGLGLWMTERVVYGSNPPGLMTFNTWTYKPPLPKDIPEDLRVTLLRNAPNPIGILRSKGRVELLGLKATGEPPLCSSICVLFALKNAILAARKDAGNNDWFRLDGPVTPEDILLKCLTIPNQFKL